MDRIQPHRECQQSNATRDNIFGISLVILGTLGLLSRLNIIFIEIHIPDFQQLFRWWPIGLVVTGLILFIADARRRTQVRQGRKHYEL